MKCKCNICEFLSFVVYYIYLSFILFSLLYSKFITHMQFLCKQMVNGVNGL